jgi:nicotinamidase-related amidase
MTRTNLPLPAFYDSKNSAVWGYRPDQQELFNVADDWRRKHHIPLAGTDKFQIHLLLIDVQKDFCFPEGSLFVGGRSGTGAIEDSSRIAEFIYRNLGVVTDITTTLDTHLPQQIFQQTFWIGEDDKPLPAMALISSDQVRSGQVRPNPSIARLCNKSYGWLLKQAQFYCDELEKTGKYTLIVWPFHCMLGSPGHALAGVIHEARLFQSFVRGSQGESEVKGANPFTENYSVLRPEVLSRHDGGTLAQKNTRFFEKLIAADAVVIAGQADSHCVKSSIDDILTEIVDKGNPELAEKIYVMQDCMSSVVIPGILDFTDEAEAAHKRFQDAGMKLVNSTDPIDSWPGIKL